jgi:glycosyltransferase involved in cell wall biosynthesis
MTQPFFSIVIPTFNRAHIIERTISSLLNQTFLDYEIIVIDDGSTDNTKEVLMPYISENFHYVWQENAERNVARNNGTKHAKGKYINWFDSDDIALPNHLAIFHKFIIENNFPKAIHSLYNEIDSQENIIIETIKLPNKINDVLHKGNVIGSNNIIVQRELALTNLFEENRNLLSEDYEMWLRFASLTTIYSIPVLTTSIIHHNTRSVFMPKSKEQLVKGYLLFINLAKNNSNVKLFLGKNYSFFLMRNLLILSVELANNGYKTSAIKYLVKAQITNLRFIFDKTFYTIIKKLIFKY